MKFVLAIRADSPWRRKPSAAADATTRQKAYFDDDGPSATVSFERSHDADLI
jgi:hypothetical protein